MTLCGHDWQPILTWSGRYKCAQCRAIAYRGTVIGGHAGRRIAQIIPYACDKSECGKPAVQVRNRRKPIRRCVEHVEGSDD